MRRITALLLAGLAALTLTGCRRGPGLLPYAREIEDMELMQTLGVDRAGEGQVEVTASSGSGDPAEGAATVVSGQAGTISAAVLGMQGEGSSYLYFGHVGQLLLGEGLARQGVEPALDYILRDVETRLDTALYLVRGGTAGKAITAAGEDGSAADRLEALAERVECEISVEQRRGLPDFLLRFRARSAFLVGLALALGAVVFLSRFVLTIQVSGNERLPTAVILSQLRQLGVYPGVYGPGIDRQQVAQEAQLALDDLAWMGINLHGTRLEVSVRETIPPAEGVDESGCWDIVARTAGLITHIEAERGQAKVIEGDTVAAGEVLISGNVAMEPPEYSDLPTRYYPTHARGRVWARTWRTMTAVIPLTAQGKAYTGKEKTGWSLTATGRRLRLWGREPEGRWEKSSSAHQAALPGVGRLPITLRREVWREYDLTSVPLNREAAQNLLQDRLRVYLEQAIGPEGEVVTTDYSAQIQGDSMEVTLVAECREEIGKERETRAISNGPEPDEGTKTG